MGNWKRFAAVALVGLTGCATVPTTLAPQAPADAAALARRSTPARTVNVAMKSGSLRQWAQKKGLRVVQEFPQLNAGTLAAPQGAEQLVAQLKGDPALRFATVDRSFALPKPKRSRSSLRLLSTDPQIGKQYSLDVMQVKDAWKVSRGAGVKIAVMDSGFDYNHPDLKNNLLPGANPYYGVKGRLFAGPSGGEHGTHVAGIIAAQANNNLGIAGVAPEAKLFPIKLWPDEDYERVRGAVDPFYTEYVRSLMNTGEALNSALINGVLLAAEEKCDVLNMSLGIAGGDPNDHQLYYMAIDYVLKKGVTVLVAAGNERQEGSPANMLALHPGIIGVGATDSKDQIAPFSNRGQYVAVSAPGVQILSTVPATIQNATFAYEYLDGTSMATPNVAGVVALLKSANRKLNPAQIKAILEKTADDQGPKGYDPDFGHGRVNALKAMALAKKL